MYELINVFATEPFRIFWLLKFSVIDYKEMKIAQTT